MALTKGLIPYPSSRQLQQAGFYFDTDTGRWIKGGKAWAGEPVETYGQAATEAEYLERTEALKKEFGETLYPSKPIEVSQTIAEQLQPPATKFTVYSSDEAKEKGWNIPDDWMIKVYPSKEKESPQISLIAPDKIEVGPHNIPTLASTGEWLSPTQAEAIRAKNKEIEAENKEIEDAFKTTFPNLSIDEVRNYANTNLEGFLKEIREIGKTPKTVLLLKRMFNDPPITEEQINTIFGTPTAIPEESKIKDIWDTFRVAATNIAYQTKQYFVGTLPNLLFPDAKVGQSEVKGMSDKEVAVVNEQSKGLRDLFRATYAQNKEEHEDWLKKHPELEARPEWQDNIIDTIKNRPEVARDWGYWANQLASGAPGTLAVLAGIVGSIFSGNPAPLIASIVLLTPSEIEEDKNLMLEHGATEDQAAILGTAVGVVSNAIMFLPFGKVLTGLKPEAAALLKRTVTGEVANLTAKSVAKQGLRQLGESEAMFLAFGVAQQGIQNAAIKLVDKKQDIFAGMTDAAISSLFQGLPLSVFGAVGKMIRVSKENAALVPDAQKQSEGWIRDPSTRDWLKPEAPEVAKESLKPEVGKELPEAKTPPVEARSFWSAWYNAYTGKAIPRGIPRLEAGEVAKPTAKVGMPEITKEPWQMTRAEAEANYAKFFVGKDIIDHKIRVARALREGKPVPPEVLAEYPDLAKQFPKAQAGMPEITKEPWQMTGKQWVGTKFDEYPFVKEGSLIRHKKLVKQALSEGKPVPPEVLAEYPDLAKQFPKAEAGMPEKGKEIFPGIMATEEVPPSPPEVGGTVPPTPPKQPPQTVEIPPPSASPAARTRIVAQSNEVVRQSLPGAVNKLLQKIPGIKNIMQWERPALRAFAEGNPHLVAAQVAEEAARSDVAARQVATRLPLFKQLHDVFGEEALRGEKTKIQFLGTQEQAKSPLTGTLLDIAQNPELYKLTKRQLTMLEAINTHNDASLDYVVNNYGAEIGRFAPKPNGAFLSNVDINENIIDWLGSEERAIATGRGKTRFWQTARDRMAADKTFKPELDIKKLIEGMDSFKASAAAGVTFKEVVGGKTRLEAMQETHPKLYDKMMGLRKELQSLQGSLARLETKLSDRVNEFLASSVEDIDILTLQDNLDVKLERGKRVGLNIETIQEQIDKVRAELKELRPAWKVANLKPYVFVQQGLYQYFKSDQAKYIIQSRKTTNNPALTFIERWRGQAFSGDFSPFAVQGSIGVLADPIGSLEATARGVKTAFEKRDFLHSITVDGLIDDMNSDIGGWAEFASLMGRQLTGVPREYSAGFLSSIPGFDKFTETTYITVTRGTKNLYDRTWQGLVKSGVPTLEAKVAAIEAAQKVYPLVNPAKLGQSQARAAVLRAMPTSYSFIRQPATLIAQASMGFAKLVTFQKLTPQERIATRTMATMAASVLITSATSAAISAKARGENDDEVLQAILDAINPDPYNGKFASLIFGEFRVPLGGPYRAIFRAIYPQDVKGIPFPVPFAGIPNFVFNRITPAVKTQISLFLNKDYYNKQIRKGQFPENIIRGLLYEIEGALPLSLSEIMGGIRREEFPEDIAQQAIAQFVGVNLIQLDNTYFHKLIRNLGLPTGETPPLYSTEKPKFTTKDLWGAVVSALSDETLDEVNKRKGYPKAIPIIIGARDLKRDVVDKLINSKLISLNTDYAKGDTYKELYDQWQKRQALVNEGGDATWTTQILVGGKYKEKTYKGEEALKAFDKEYPQAESGNMSQTQYVTLTEYFGIPEKDRDQWLKDNPDKAKLINFNPREDWLKSHPKENALLAVFGQAKILSMEAYNETQRLMKDFDFPDSAAPEHTLPPKTSIETHFKYEDFVANNQERSWEAQLLLLQDAKAAEEAGVESYAHWRGLTLPDTNIKALEILVKSRDKYTSYDEEIPKKYTDMSDYEVNKMPPPKGVNADWWARQDVKTKRDRLIAEERENMLAKDEAFRDDRNRVEAYQKDFPDDQIENYVNYYKVEDKGFRRKRMLVENPEFAKLMHEIVGIDIPKPEDVPPVQYDDIYDAFKGEFDKLEGLGDFKSEHYIENTDDRDIARYNMRYSEGGVPTEFGKAEKRRDAYKLNFPTSQIESYVYWFTSPDVHKDTCFDSWWKEHPDETFYEEDWWLQEHPEFEQTMVDLYKKTDGEEGWKELRDYSKTPTKEVHMKYRYWLTLLDEKGNPDRVARRALEAANPDLDMWLHITKGTKLETEQKKKPPTRSEKEASAAKAKEESAARLSEAKRELEKIQQELRGK